MILGHPWLKKYNPAINWNTHTITIGKITINSITNKEQTPHLPEYAKQFEKVFSKQKAERFPPTRAYDHKIELKPGFIPKVGKVLPISYLQRQALEEFIQENLEKGYIKPSI